MRTMQGIQMRRRLIAGALARMAAYTAVFVLLAAAARVLVWPTLSEWIADVTSVWMDVPADQADLYRMMGLQEGAMMNGMYRFRDLSDYHHVADFITGPVVWSAYAVGLAAVALWSVGCAARGVDVLAEALERAASGEEPTLPEGFEAARAAFDHLEERAQARERAAEYAETRKNELVAYLAHDIKTPLTSVIGYLALLAEEPDLALDRRERYATAALEKARRLDAMMDEFFEITRYNLGAIPIERENADVALLLGQVADELVPVAAAHDVTIAVDAPEGLTAFLDPEKMARVLGNLLKNAVAYAEPGSTVACRARSADGQLVLKVEDHGKEIAPAHLARIFDKFYREDGARSGKGAGLGLAIAREIVEAHDGTIEAASEHGATTFTVRVPA